jgi:Zn-dependent protease
MEKLAEGVLWYVVFIFSTVCHEAAHAFTALKLGDKTAYEGGQVTLDPRPHIQREPIGTVVVPIISFLAGGWMFGWASAPYDPYWAMRYPKRSAMMALVGPLSNFGLVISTGVLIRLGMLLNVFYAPERINFSHVVGAEVGIFATLATVLSILFSLNLILGIFNLIPLPPLDGSGVLPLFFDENTARSYMRFVWNSPYMFFGIFIAWRLFDVIFDPIHLHSINLLYLGVGSYH